MAGVDRIINQISDKAKVEADAILAEAQKKAAEIKERADKESALAIENTMAKADKEVAAIKSKEESASDLNYRRSLLKAKQEVINDYIFKAYNRLADLGDKEYFEVILKILNKNVQPKSGIIAFSDKDLKRMPADFIKKCDETAAANSGKLTLADKAADIDNGFILIYDDIEENCSFKSIFDAERDELVDLVHGILS